MGQVILSVAPVGQRVMLGDVKLKIALTDTGCKGVCIRERRRGNKLPVDGLLFCT